MVLSKESRRKFNDGNLHEIVMVKDRLNERASNKRISLDSNRSIARMGDARSIIRKNIFRMIANSHNKLEGN